MATKQPRLNVVLDPHIYKTIHRLANRERLSMSLIARDLLKEALITYEDVFWAKEAEIREKSLVKSKLLQHEDVWDF